MPAGVEHMRPPVTRQTAAGDSVWKKVARRGAWLAAAALCAGLVTSAAAAGGQVKVDGLTFTLPDGFTVERVAGPPVVDRPVEADFDDRGRLYVTDSSG